MKYICETELDQSEIHAACDEGRLIPWRLDAEGRQWFTVRPATIYGIPKDSATAAADCVYEVDDIDEDFDDEDGDEL